MTYTTDYEAQCDLAAAHRIAVFDGLNEGTWNHFSVMSPEVPERMWISPGDTHWSMVRAGNLTLMGPQGEVVSGPEPNPAAWIIHYPIHRTRPDALCLMHTHPPYATALAMRKDATLDTQCCQAAAFFHGDIAYFDVYDGVLRGEEEGERMAEALGDKRVLLLRNHGVLIANQSIAKAYMDLYMLERACYFQLLATRDGAPLNAIPEDIAATMGSRGRTGRAGHFEGMKQVIDAQQPDYKH
ncbi:MAG: class II aldolase/adducin family protein [Pseudomonadota bacterium]